MEVINYTAEKTHRVILVYCDKKNNIVNMPASGLHWRVKNDWGVWKMKTK